MVAAVEDTLEEQMEDRLTKVESDVTHMRTDIARLQSDVAHMRTDIADLKLGYRQLRAGVTKLDKSVSDLRDERHTSFAKVDVRFEKLESKIDKKSLQDRLWTGGMILAVLSVMAHGFKWL